MTLVDLLILQEGLRLKPYDDTKGVLTIGCGRNLESVGITSEEALYLLQHDIETARDQMEARPWFMKLDPVRQDVITNMALNLGIPKLLEFNLMINALIVNDYAEAAKQMLDSQWAKEVGTRAQTLADMMISGKYPNS